MKPDLAIRDSGAVHARMQRFGETSVVIQLKQICRLNLCQLGITSG
ncbi:hypothetical protein SLEP1_g47662 [Rubroshorea leprosula]|uniref:Uncharacterized protein n=1 Tax=Rubroshorea leprosula TaxID=152421 RepID=A0AAV5HWG4_9ROSI|nr:hypothetical protein SLEP1_g6721 [Rubroshorea leprosula]GKV39976.1 hypothetical protein SLEP1_g47662 [Rubroshorea leprosula]